jgi:hypothetical protein
LWRALLVKRALVWGPAWVAPSRPRRRRREAFLLVAVFVVAPGGAARAIPIAVTGPLLPPVFFLFTI